MDCYQITCYYIPEDGTLHNHLSEDLITNKIHIQVLSPEH
jgi:hypothetical protein